LLALGADLLEAWQTPTTSPRDKKELLRTLLEEVIVTVYKDERIRTCRDVLLRLSHGLMRRPTGSKPIAVSGKHRRDTAPQPSCIPTSE